MTKKAEIKSRKKHYFQILMGCTFSFLPWIFFWLSNRSNLIVSPPRFCENDWDCELNGACINSTYCHCNISWKGPTCATLNLQPAPSKWGVWPPYGDQQKIKPNSSVYSWGISVVAEQHHPSEEDGEEGYYVGYVNAGCYICREGMVSGTYIGRVKSISPIGPFQFEEIILPHDSFNPHILRLRNGSLALFFRYNKTPLKNATICTGSTKQFYPEPPIRVEPDSLNVALCETEQQCTADLDPIRLYVKGWENVHISNPSAIELDDGSFMLSYRYNLGDGEHVGVALAETIFGPYENVANLSILGEDPYLWQEKQSGNFHILFHVEDGRSYGSWPSLHAFSQNGRQWGVSKSVDGKGAYSTSVEYFDDHDGGDNLNVIDYYRRERPDILFVNDEPAYFYSSVQEGDKPQGCHWGYSRSIVQSFVSISKF